MGQLEGSSGERRTSRVLAFLSSPVVGIVSSVASVIAIPLAFYFYFESKEERDLVFTVHPARSVLVQADRPSELSIAFRGEPLVSTNVVAVDVALWNQGRASIRAADVLEPLELRVPKVRLLEARISRASRAVTGLRVQPSEQELREGRVPIAFTIMEFNDGAVVQLIYAGDVEANVALLGTLERQGQPRRHSSRVGGRNTTVKTLTAIFIGQVVIFLTIGHQLWLWRRQSITAGRLFRFLVACAVLNCLMFAGFVLYFYWRDSPASPFGF